MDGRADYEGFVLKLRPGEVGRLILTESETTRSVKPRLRHAGRRLGIELDVWSVGPFPN